MQSAILRPKEVMRRTGLTRSLMRNLVKRGAFPAPFKIAGTRAVGFCEQKVERWMDSQKLGVRQSA